MARYPRATDPYQASYSLSKTSATGLLIDGVVTFLAMFYLLHRARPDDPTPAYYLPLCLAYGIPCLVAAIAGVFWMTREIRKPHDVVIYSIICIVFAGLSFFSAIPLLAVWGNVEFMVCIMVIAACEIVIASVAIKSYKEGK